MLSIANLILAPQVEHTFGAKEECRQAIPLDPFVVFVGGRH
jgi:hypothetical protein